MVEKPIKILLVEDSPEDAELLIRHLKRGGVECEWARVDSAPELIESLERVSWDIVISDYIMPGFSGIRALEIVREGGFDLPVIIVSGKMGEETAVEAMKAGANDYLLKDNLSRLGPAVAREIRENEARKRRKRVEKELKNLKHAIETIPIGVTVADCEGKIIFTNQAEAEMHGYTVDELIGRDVQIFAPVEYHSKWNICDIKEFSDTNRESVNTRKDGSYFPVNLVSSVVFDEDDEPVAVITVCEDITDRKLAEQKLKYLSTHDTLTGFYNRAFFDEEMARLCTDCALSVGVIMLDVDGLKAVNDTLGHSAGDKVLKQTANVLMSVFRTEDIVARIGGDEFVVLLPGADDSAVEKAVHRIRDVVRQAARSLGGLGLSLSIGAATACDSSRLVETLRLADERMYDDKLSKRHRNRLGKRSMVKRRTDISEH